MAEVRSVGTDSNTVGETSGRQINAQALIDDFYQRRDVLDVISRYASIDGENPETFRLRDQPDELPAVAFEIHQNGLLAAAFTFDVVDIDVIAQLRIDKCRDKNRNPAEIGRFQYAAFAGIMLREMFPDEFVQHRGADWPQAIKLTDDLAEHLLDRVEIALGFKGIGHSV